jgi:hypothetical protein
MKIGEPWQRRIPYNRRGYGTCYGHRDNKPYCRTCRWFGARLRTAARKGRA